MAVASLLCQTYENWELIFVDDGSTDGSAEFVESVEDKRIKVFRFDKNYGRPYARQKALDEARGDYVAMLDSDDWYYSDKLEKQVKFMEENPSIGVVSSGMIIVNNDQVATGYRCCRKINSQINNGYKVKLNIANAPSLIKSKYAKKTQYNNIRGEDVDFLARILIEAKYSNISEILYVYAEQASFNVRNIREIYLSRKSYLKKLDQNYSIKKREEIVKMKLKYLIKRLLFLLSLEEYILKRRNMVPTEEMLEKYNHEKNIVLKTANELKESS